MFKYCISEKLIKDIFESMHAEIYKLYKLNSRSKGPGANCQFSYKLQLRMSYMHDVTILNKFTYFKENSKCFETSCLPKL